MRYKKIFNTDLPDFLNASGLVTLQISTVCNAHCKFCMNESNPYKSERVGFRPYKEIQEQIETYIDYSNQIKTVLIGSSSHGYEHPKYKLFNNRTSGVLNYGEPTIHPDFFDILKLIREKLPHVVIWMFTNGMLLTEPFIHRLAKYGPYKINLSLPTIIKERWMDHYSSSETKYNIAISSIELMKKYGVQFIPNIIPFYGIDDVENTIEYLSNRNIKEILIEKLGYTNYTPKEYVDYFQSMQLNSDRVDEICRKYKIFRHKLHNDIKDKHIIKKLLQFNESGTKSYWFTSAAAYETIYETISNIKNICSIKVDTDVIIVENKVYGGNVNCVGLWMISDIRDKITKLNLEDQCIIIPSLFLDDYGYDLMGENIQDYIKVCKNKLSIIVC